MVASAALTAALLDSDRAVPRAVAARAPRCPTRAASTRVAAALRNAEARYALESRGTVSDVDINQIAHDARLIGALSAGRPTEALAAANRQLVRHVVQTRVTRGVRVLVDANASSFDVSGPQTPLYGWRGRYLGELRITVQDVIGFIKLVHKFGAADVVVRGPVQARASLAVALGVPLSESGCVKIAQRRYAVRSFTEASFTGEPLKIWVLTAA